MLAVQVDASEILCVSLKDMLRQAPGRHKITGVSSALVPTS